MSSIAIAVFKATIGLLVDKARDKAAEKLKDGDVTDQKFRGLIVREINDIKSKLDGLSRKDLGHPKTQTMQTADCRLQTVQTMQTVQTVQTE